MMTGNEQINYATSPCQWTDRDSDIIADYVVLKSLGAKNISKLDVPK